MRTRSLLIALLALVPGASGLPGCGGEEKDPAGRTVTAEAADGVEVVGGEYFFDPETIVVEGRPGPLEITLENQGDMAHNLRLFEEATEVGGTPTFEGGEARTVRLDLAPGAYRMVCTVANHEELGMVGELEIR